jgi:hypothetical protein
LLTMDEDFVVALFQRRAVKVRHQNHAMKKNSWAKEVKRKKLPRYKKKILLYLSKDTIAFIAKTSLIVQRKLPNTKSFLNLHTALWGEV